MNCYYHPQTSAVAICKSCSKGLCAECANEIGDGVACRNRCEERAKMINRMIDRNNAILTTSNTHLRRNAIFMSVSGVLFVALGAAMGALAAEIPGLIFAVLGVVFVWRGFLHYSKSGRYPTDQESPEMTGPQSGTTPPPSTTPDSGSR